LIVGDGFPGTENEILFEIFGILKKIIEKIHSFKAIMLKEGLIPAPSGLYILAHFAAGLRPRLLRSSPCRAVSNPLLSLSWLTIIITNIGNYFINEL
jgi:hypothetical protein